MVKDEYVPNRNHYIANRNLKKLHGSGFEVAHDEPDIRGWKVVNMENIEIGKVDDLLFDADSRKVRYLAIKLNGKPLNLLSRDLLVPIGLAELDKRDDFVLLPDVTAGQLAALPDYKKGKVTVETERAIRTVFAGIANAPGKYGDDSQYAIDSRECCRDNYSNSDSTYLARRRPTTDTEDINPGEVD